MAKRNDIVSRAIGWIGRKESNGGHKEIIDIYNAHKPLARGYKVKYTDEWCATFVSAVAIKCGAANIIPTECGCEKMIALFKALNCWVEADNYRPAAGDVIFYDWEDKGAGDCVGGANHVGIVEKVVDNTITVIEGNINASVGRRTIKINGKYIRGYGVPKYEKEQEIKVDNTPDKYAEAAINWAVQKGILKGNEKGDYMLHSNVTRQDMLVFLYRAIG